MTPVLFDADAAASSDLASLRRARTTVADADASYRADLISRYISACKSDADEFSQLRLLAEAARYDKQHPGDAVPLADELHGTQLLAGFGGEAA